MITYWMMLEVAPVTDWYVYRVDGTVYTQLDASVGKWEPKYRDDRHPRESDYSQVPDSALTIMGIPL
jgi:hypothetical protein